MKMRYEDKVVFLSFMAGVAAWIVDAVADAWVFSREGFLDSLLFDISPHELYFRLFVLICFFTFGVVISGTLTRRKFAEEELRKALARLEDEKAKSEAIVAAIPDGISIQDRSFRVLYQNQVHKNLVGDRAGELCYKAYSQRDSICPGCPVERSFQDGGIHVLEKERPTASGAAFIEINASPLRNAQGEIVAGIEAVRDITERRGTEKSLKLYSEAIHVAMDGIQIVGLDGRVLYSNKAVEELYGYTASELAGVHVNEMNADPAFADRVIIPAIAKAGRWSGELRVRHKDGSEFPIWLSASLVRNNRGEPLAMVGIIRDMTERRRAEEELREHRERLEELVEERTAELKRANARLQQEMAERERMEDELVRAQKLESLGVLAGGIAHDFNNLLGVIMGNVSLAMLDCDPSHPGFKQLSNAERAGLRAQELTRQLLTFSKGGTPLKKLTSLPAVIGEAAGFSLRGSSVKHDLLFPPDLWAVEADEGQMNQVFQNLLINADHAMPAGGMIRITAENVVAGPEEIPALAAGRYVRVSVRDTGTGISPEHLPKIFDPYFTTKPKGSGLGLSATYSIIQKHGGSITVESTPGKGTVFHLYLPASEGTPSGPAKHEPVVPGRGRVLVMDDEEEMRRTTGDMLNRLGYDAAFAADGEQAIARYRQAREAGSPFDLVIMDLTVPGGMGGKEAVGRLLELDPLARVIVSSGYSQDPVMADYQAYGFKGRVSKPYRLHDLSEVVAKVVGSGENSRQ